MHQPPKNSRDEFRCSDESWSCCFLDTLIKAILFGVDSGRCDVGKMLRRERYRRRISSPVLQMRNRLFGSRSRMAKAGLK